MEDILALQDISISFGGVEVLHNVSFNVRKGEIHSLIGENGAGKSTLMKIISGVYIPDKGRIVKSGKEIRLRNPAGRFFGAHRHCAPGVEHCGQPDRRGEYDGRTRAGEQARLY